MIDNPGERGQKRNKQWRYVNQRAKRQNFHERVYKTQDLAMATTNSSEFLETPLSFPFPFPPYDIQEDFMRHLFRSLEDSKLGIFESPTGTGKSMSLICGSLNWLLMHERKRKEDLKRKLASVSIKDDDADEDDWIAAAGKKMAEDAEKARSKLELEALLKKERRMEDLRRRRKSIKRDSVLKVDSAFDELFRDSKEIQEAIQKELAALDRNPADDFEEDILVEEYESSDDEDGKKEGYRKAFETDEEEEEDFSLRIFYCSRTHSQLTQFVREVQKSPFSDDVRVISLASRNNLCINDKVKGLESNTAINDRCLEMQKKSGKSEPLEDKDLNAKKGKKKDSKGSCPFFKQGPIGLLRDQALLQVQDIEQLVTRGRALKACPYYASRNAVDDAQIVILPYNTLLHKPTRDTLGITLRNSVVIVDEAHNLLDTISHIHSVEVTGKQLSQTHNQMLQYMERYKSRLKAKNLLYIKQIRFILANFIRVLGGKPEQEADQVTSTPSRMVKPHTFLDESEVFNINIFKLLKYITKSKIALKLKGFSEFIQKAPSSSQKDAPLEKGIAGFLNSLDKNQKAGQSQKGAKSEAGTEAKTKMYTGTPLLTISELLRACVDAKSEGKILISCRGTLAKSSIKYCLLNPSSPFQDLVRECRAIVVAGGTMQPISEFKEQLFVSAGAGVERVAHFSCGHVIPKENILPIVLQRGPSGRELDFTFGSRDRQETMDEFYSVLSNCSNVIPGGIVCFFPSYDYEGRVYSYLESSGRLQKLSAKKKIFREPKRSDEMDQVLKDYGRACKSGAILLSVVGGKMSEGINFSDDLGRCVVMVGMPYPNSQSLELKEKMAYLNATVSTLIDGRTAGQLHYENLCMKAVNQSIGRAIRHKGDYACILLLDQRYKRPGVVAQLPNWIRQHVNVSEKFGPTVPMLKKFFKDKEAN